MAIEFSIARVLYTLVSFKRRVLPQQLSPEEAHLLDLYRTMSEDDRIALRYLCNTFREISKF